MPQAWWRAGFRRRGERVEALDVGAVPGPEQPAVQHPLDRLDHVEILGRRHAAPRRHHAVGPVELVGQRLEPDAGELAGLLGGGLLRVENRGVVELGEGVDEQLPVAADVGAVLVHLGHLVERIAGETGRRTRRGSPCTDVVFSGSRLTKMNPSHVSTWTAASP